VCGYVVVCGLHFGADPAGVVFHVLSVSPAPCGVKGRAILLILFFFSASLAGRAHDSAGVVACRAAFTSAVVAWVFTGAAAEAAVFWFSWHYLVCAGLALSACGADECVTVGASSGGFGPLAAWRVEHWVTFPAASSSSRSMTCSTQFQSMLNLLSKDHEVV
jgi:hypothetical protein